MKQILTLLTILIFSTLLHAQVGINNTNPKASLDISATNQANPSNTDGLLIPRIDDFPATNPTAAQNGMMVYLTTTSGSNPPGIYYWNNGSTSWKPALGVDDQTIDQFALSGTTLGLSLEDDGVAPLTVDLSSLAGDDDWTDVGADIERQTGNVYIGDTNATNNDLYLSDRIIDWDTTNYYLDPDDISKVDEIEFDSGSVSDPSIRFSDVDTGFFSPSNATTAYSANGTEAFRIQSSGEISIGTTSPSSYDIYMKNSFTSKILSLGANNSNNNPLIDGTINGDGTRNIINANVLSGNRNFSHTAIKATSQIGDVYVAISENLGTTIYGLRSIISEDNTVGNKYGLYSEATKLNSYAGYFLGRVSVGTTTLNNYILPSTRGTNGQIMRTDGSGNLSWVTPISGTDNQTIDQFSLSGTTLGISLEDDGVAPLTVDLSSLEDSDADWFESGDTPPNDINDAIYTNGYVGIKNTIPNVELDVIGKAEIIDVVGANGYPLKVTRDASTTGAAIFAENTSSYNLRSYAAIETANILTELTTEINKFETGIDRKIGLIVSGTNIWGKHGVIVDYNTPSTNNFTGENTAFLADITYNGGIAGKVYGFKAEIQGIGLAHKYGFYTKIPSSSGGVQFGLYSEVTSSSGYAGYFLGNVVVGTQSGGVYVFPTYRGINGQIMQTDGSGNVSWVNSTAVGTDNQNISGSGLSGTDLTIGIDNGTSEVIDLTSLQDGTGTDNQTVDQFGLSGTTLGISLEDDGSSPYTVNLSSLQDGTGTDNQNINGSGLFGTDLTIGIENGGNQIIDLSSLQDGTGTDSQDISGSSLSGTNLIIGIENGSSQTVNLSSLQDSDWYESGDTPPNSINDNIYTYGNVAIGTTSASYRLDVRKTSSSGYVAQIFNTSTLLNADALRIKINAATPNTSNNFIGFFNGSDALRGKITGSATGVNYVTTSDRRLKTNIVSINNALQLINEIQPREYEYKSNLGTNEYGFIAQELQLIYPQAVTGNPKSNVETDPMMIDYSRLTPILTAGIKELNDKVTLLETENKSLKNKLSKYEQLEERLTALENNINLSVTDLVEN